MGADKNPANQGRMGAFQYAACVASTPPKTGGRDSRYGIDEQKVDRDARLQDTPEFKLGGAICFDEPIRAEFKCNLEIFSSGREAEEAAVAEAAAKKEEKRQQRRQPPRRRQPPKQQVQKTEEEAVAEEEAAAAAKDEKTLRRRPPLPPPPQPRVIRRG